jgi:hypothetical protein
VRATGFENVAPSEPEHAGASAIKDSDGAAAESRADDAAECVSSAENL